MGGWCPPDPVSTPLRTPDDWLAFFRLAAGDGTAPLTSLDHYLELIMAVGEPHSIPEWDEEGWDYRLCEMGGLLFEFTAEIGWTDVYPLEGCADVETRERRSPEVEDCARAFRDALQHSNPFDQDQWREAVHWLGIPVFGLLGFEEDDLLSVHRYGSVLLRRKGVDGPWQGPFATLEEAVGPRIEVGEGIDGIWCDEWPEKLLVRRLDFVGTRASLYVNHQIRTLAELRQIRAGQKEGEP
jgi:hypothetical protein